MVENPGCVQEKLKIFQKRKQMKNVRIRNLGSVAL